MSGLRRDNDPGVFRIIIERGSSILGDRIVDGPFVSIGRSETNHVVLDDAAVSASHVVLKVNDDGSLTAINQSAKGTMMNGRSITSARIDGPVELEIASFKLTVLPQPESGQTTEEHIEASHDTTVQSEIPRSGDSRPTMAENTAENPMASLRLRLEDGSEREFSLGMTTMIGRSHDADIELDAPDISRHHCTVFRRAGAFYLKRLSRVNPVAVNGKKLGEGENRRLVAGDVIDICGTLLDFHASSSGSHRIPEGGSNLGMSCRVSQGSGGSRTIEIIGFLGGKNASVFERELDQLDSSVTRLTIDLGYVVGIDDGGLESLEQAVRVASMRGIPLRLVSVSQRILDLIQTSSRRAVIAPHLSDASVHEGAR